MSNALSFVGRVLGNPRPRVLPCGHVELIAGMERTVVEFADAKKYADELQRQLDNAIAEAAGMEPK